MTAVSEQVHVADFHPPDLLLDPFAEILPQFLPAALLKEFNPVVHHPLGHEVLHEEQPLENEGGPEEPIAHGHIQKSMDIGAKAFITAMAMTRNR